MQKENLLLTKFSLNLAINRFPFHLNTFDFYHENNTYLVNMLEIENKKSLKSKFAETLFFFS